MDGLLLLTRPGVDGSGRAGEGREPFAVDWIDAALRFLDERLAELEAGDPVIDVVRLGQYPPEGAVAWAMVTRLDVRPWMRNPRDGGAAAGEKGQDDQADLQLAITCMAGTDLVRADPNASIRIASRVRSLLDEWARSEVVAVEIGGARDVSLDLGRARIEDADAGEQRAVRLPSVVVDQGTLYSTSA